MTTPAIGARLPALGIICMQMSPLAAGRGAVNLGQGFALPMATRIWPTCSARQCIGKI